MPDDITTLTDVTLDTVAVLNQHAGSFGADGVVIERVVQDWTGKDEVAIFLSSGDVYTLTVRQLPEWAANQARGQ
jgi:hypothetical protein